MKKATRKLISILLLCVLLLSIALPALAAPYEDEIAPQVSCSHENYTTMGSRNLGETYYNTTSHADKIQVSKKCHLCYYTFYEYYYVNFEAHTNRYSSSKCNGTVQSWYYHCTVCNHSTVIEKHDCPGAPHGSTCLWLPN